MIRHMTSSAPKVTAGSVGTVETRYLDLPGPLTLDCGRQLHPIRIAYETYGTLSPARDNVILVCHALSGDAHAAGYSAAPVAAGTRDGFRAEERDGSGGRGLGWWDGMIGPGKAFDTEKFFVVSTNLLGGCRGTTGPSSIESGDRAALRIGFPGDHRGRHGPRRAGVPARARHHPPRRRGRRFARGHAGARVGRPVRRATSGPSFRSPARMRCSRRGWPGTRSRATPLRPTPTGRAGIITAPGVRPTREWAWPGWWGTSRTSLRSRWGTSSGAGCSSPETSATSSLRRSSRSRAICGTRRTRS